MFTYEFADMAQGITGAVDTHQAVNYAVNNVPPAAIAGLLPEQVLELGVKPVQFL